MAKRSRKKKISSFFSRKLRFARRAKLQPIGTPPLLVVGADGPATPIKVAKKKAGSRLWMVFDRLGKSVVTELDKSAIIRKAAIPVRDLRILGPIFSHSSSIIAREKAIVVNLEFIKAIITADEVLLLDPLCNEVLPFVNQLRRQINLNSPSKVHEYCNFDFPGSEMPQYGGQWFLNENGDGERVLPFEFQVLEVALEFVCTYLDSNVSDLERDAYAALEELTKNISTKSLERVRSLKTNLTRLLARVQKVRDEIEHLLDDNEDMSQLYLTRKQIQDKQFEALMTSATLNNLVITPNLLRLHSHVRGNSGFISFHSDDNSVEDMEMLLEAYFMELEATRNKILVVREYIADTEGYVNFQLGNQRNELIQLHMFLKIFDFSLAVYGMITGFFGMSIPCSFFYEDGVFVPFLAVTTAASLLVFLLLVAYARWKKLLFS